MTDRPARSARRTWWSGAGPDPDPGIERRARSRTLGSGIATSVLCRAIAAVGPLALVVITLGYFGKDLYGLWMTIVALTSMVMWADLGLGNGLMTQLAAAHSRRDVAAARTQVSTTYAILTAGAAVVLIALWGLAGSIPWAELLAPDSASVAGSAGPIALICLSAFAINIPLSLAQRIQFAAQRVSISNLWQAAGSLTALALAWVAVRSGAGPLVVVAAAAAGPPLVNLVNNVYLFTGPCRDIAPRLRSVHVRAAAGLLGLGGQFLVISVCSSIGLNVDSLIIAHTLGLQAVTDYAVTARVFLVLGSVIVMINLPFWPTAGDALEQGDRPWLRSTTRRMTLFSVGAVAATAAVMLLFGARVIDIWTSGNVVPQGPILIAWSVWWLLLAAASPRFMVQNAAGVLRPQIAGWCLYLVISVPAKWVAAQTLGVPAVVWVSVVSYLLVMWPAVVIGYRRATAHDTTLPQAHPELQR